jgi:hypothetical protein
MLFDRTYRHVSQINCMVLKHELWFSAWEPRTAFCRWVSAPLVLRISNLIGAAGDRMEGDDRTVR